MKINPTIKPEITLFSQVQRMLDYKASLTDMIKHTPECAQRTDL